MKNDRSLEKECKHDLVELTKGFIYGNNGYSPTILKCTKCKKVFRVELGRYSDRLREMKVKGKE